MTISHVLKKYHTVEIDLLLSHILGKPREFLYMNGGNRLTRMQTNRLTRMVRRRLKGEPIAYILGYKDFYGLRFKVDRRVLIPRPETEELVDLAIASASEAIFTKDRRVGQVKPWPPRDDRKFKILDLGTGSGCVAISITKGIGYRVKEMEIFATDKSPAALAVAKQNAKTILGKNSNTSEYWSFSRINFIHSDLFKNIRGKFDLVVANLPYVPLADYRLKIKDLRYEPQMALVDPKKDFDLYERFFKELAFPKILNRKSLIYFEIDPKAKPFIAKWVKKYLPQGKVKFYKDFNYLWRYAEIKST